MIVFNHADEGVVEGAHSNKFISFLNAWPKDDRADSDSYVVGGHLVLRFVLHELLEELNEELKGIVIQWIFGFHQTKSCLDKLQILIS